ncbi:MAG TPA: DUF917 domain-containing protein [Solirubrobacteraceae bacterium]
MRLDASNLPAVARGCAVLGTGGGGDPDLGLTMALRAVAEYGPVDVVPIEALPDEALVVPCGLIGAPSVASERIWNGDEGRILRNEVERLRGRGVAALMPYEIAGANGILPVTWAARIGLPLLDADGMGRAFPGLRQQAMHVAGIDASPLVLTDARGNAVVVYASEVSQVERLARSAAASLGGVAAAALYCMTVRDAGGAVVHGSLSRALALGEAMRAGSAAERVAALCQALGGTVLIEGKVLDVERRIDAGSLKGSATIQSAGHAGLRHLRLELQNEFLIAVEDGVVRAVVPDLICVLASDSGEPIATEWLRYAQRVSVLAAPGPALWRSAGGLALAGPSAFGYDVAYAPVGHEAADARA